MAFKQELNQMFTKEQNQSDLPSMQTTQNTKSCKSVAPTYQEPSNRVTDSFLCKDMPLKYSDSHSSLTSQKKRQKS
jgi:hypothetical protein